MKPQCPRAGANPVATSRASEKSKAPSAATRGSASPPDPASPDDATKDPSPDEAKDPSRDPSDERSGVALLWTAYRREPTQERRAELVLHYSPLVKYVAGRLSIGMPSSVERADLVSYGIFGLIDAIDRFAHDRACTFETYAISRIRGAIIDEMRRVDWVPRSVRAKINRVQWAIADLEETLQRSPTDDELARYLGISARRLETTLAHVFSTSTMTLDELVADTEERTADEALACPAQGPGDLVAEADTRRIVASTIWALPERERTVLSLYYYENLTLAEIGSILGVTESRICQIHARAVLQMRSRLRPPMQDTERRSA